MENQGFEIGDTVKITNLEYLKTNKLSESTEATIESFNGHSSFYKEEHATIKLKNTTPYTGRYVVYLKDLYLVKPRDMVNHPPHYTFGKFEVIDVLMDWFSDKPLLWQVVKYVARAYHKGNTIEDLKKARFYLDKEIELLQEKSELVNNDRPR